MYSSKNEHLTPAQQAAQDDRSDDDLRTGHFMATEHTSAPLDGFMTRLMAQELPILDSASRNRVYEILREYDGPEITSQEELPDEIRDIMDLY
ncbi:Hypothetical Protein NG00_00094 [Corynebacterium camporealensis]|uniref:Uncharacterized protein n=1 Tax=Corynebacterium camporealensis TaxID=161896 RepID=A0A0F6T9G5_9CORY|nr:hypothetical protein [Corynebacterium camporealensis]AKE38104.1 hypothetical protein UL81_00555 [Corynebacterium camporealensis]AVH87424.1 Hypothetical Protein NG00_00094 [Corynebacterium camporealensis]MDY5840869.1 hypothetical protein [Corynebacterium camporealensis]